MRACTRVHTHASAHARFFSFVRWFRYFVCLFWFARAGTRACADICLRFVYFCLGLLNFICMGCLDGTCSNAHRNFDIATYLWMFFSRMFCFVLIYANPILMLVLRFEKNEAYPASHQSWIFLHELDHTQNTCRSPPVRPSAINKSAGAAHGDFFYKC